MPVTYQTKSVTEKTKQKKLQVLLAAKETQKQKIDELGELDAKRRALAEQEKLVRIAYDKALQEFRNQYGNEAFAELSPEEKLTLEGHDYSLEFGKLALQRVVVDNPAAFVALEDVEEGLALQLLSFRLADLDKYLDTATLKTILYVSRKTERPVKMRKIDSKK